MDTYSEQSYSVQSSTSNNSNPVTVYMTTITSTVAILKKQRAVQDFLEARKIDFQLIDMCSDLTARPKMLDLMPEDEKNEKSPILPPQIFNGRDYCGDYNEFEDAKEMDLIYSFFKLMPPQGSSEHKLLLKYKSAKKKPCYTPRGFF